MVRRPSASPQLLGNFFKWSIFGSLELGSKTRLQFHSRFVRSPNRRAVFEWAAPPAAVATHNERVAKWGSGGSRGRCRSRVWYAARTHAHVAVLAVGRVLLMGRRRRRRRRCNESRRFVRQSNVNTTILVTLRRQRSLTDTPSPFADNDGHGDDAL